MKYNGRGFDVNIAVFRQLFRDFQLNTFNGLNFVVENINSCKGDLWRRPGRRTTVPSPARATAEPRPASKS